MNGIVPELALPRSSPYGKTHEWNSARASLTKELPQHLSIVQVVHNVPDDDPASLQDVVDPAKKSLVQERHEGRSE